MQNLIDNSVQQATRSITASPVYNEDASIWHHMSEALHQSLYRVLTLLIAVLPGILAFFVALLVFALAGMLISWVLRRCLTWVKFDLRVARKSGTDWAPASSPTEIVARASFWMCVLLGLIIGVSAFDTSYATGAAVAHLVAALLDSCRRRRPTADCRRSDRAVSCPLSSDQRRERAVAIRKDSFSGREVACSCSDGGHGARSSCR